MRTTKHFAGIAALLAAAVPVIGAANAGAADNYRHLGTLTVHETEDWGSGGDEPFITVNGKEVWDAGGEMDEPSSAAINLNVRIGSKLGDNISQFQASLLGDEVPSAGNRCVVLVLGTGNMLLEHLLPTLGRGIAVGVCGEKRPFPLLQRGHGVPADRRARVVARQRDQCGQLAQPAL